MLASIIALPFSLHPRSPPTNPLLFQIGELLKDWRRLNVIHLPFPHSCSEVLQRGILVSFLHLVCDVKQVAISRARCKLVYDPLYSQPHLCNAALNTGVRRRLAAHAKGGRNHE
jgi:hypothetical protein